MRQPTNAKFGRNPGHIIARPRLTRLLDNASAHVILLVAPAGFGKTTLAREWVGATSFWYNASPASGDVAALVRGLVDAITSCRTHESERIDRLLASSTEPESSIASMADALEKLIRPHHPRWIVIDDYHLIGSATAADNLVEELSRCSSVNILITTRQRPSWATSRRILYGEIIEVGPDALAMTQPEVDTVLARANRREAGELAALAHGWPMVVGLAATSDRPLPPNVSVPQDELYTYFADELFGSLTHVAQDVLPELALVGAFEPDAVASVYDDVGGIVEEAARAGFLTHGSGTAYVFHPLLRAFLLGHLERRSTTGALASAHSLVDAFIAKRRWDDASEVLDAIPHRVQRVALLRAALDDMLAAGRLQTLDRWITEVAGHAVADLAAAELAFRRGDFRAAEALAASSANRLARDDPFRSRAFYRAGQSAHFANKEREAYSHHGNAYTYARTARDRQNALWGQIISAAEQELPETTKLVAMYEAFPAESANEVLRIAAARLLAARVNHSLHPAVSAARIAARSVDAATDPMIRTSFLNVYTDGLILSGDYDEATDLAERELSDIAQHDLEFALPHALLVRARAALGVRMFALAEQLATDAVQRAASMVDPYSDLNGRGVMCRLWTSRGAPDRGMDAARSEPPRATPTGLRGEYLGARAVAAACSGAMDAARCDVREVERCTVQLEARSLALWAQAILEHATSGQRASLAIDDALEFMICSGNVDAFVLAYRGYPQLLTLVGRSTPPTLVTEILARAHDWELGRAAGLPIESPRQPRKHVLSPRECEVHELLRQGLKNREIARALFISEVTVKAHVRSILRKLDARTRTEAALKRQIG